MVIFTRDSTFLNCNNHKNLLKMSYSKDQQADHVKNVIFTISIKPSDVGASEIVFLKFYRTGP